MTKGLNEQVDEFRGSAREQQRHPPCQIGVGFPADFSRAGCRAQMNVMVETGGFPVSHDLVGAAAQGKRCGVWSSMSRGRPFRT